MKLTYLINAQKIVLSCLDPYSTVKANFFNDNLNSLDSYQQFTQCSSIYGHSIILYNSDYYVISDVICGNYKRCYEPLIGELGPILIDTTQNLVPIVEEEEKEEKIEEEEEEIILEEIKKEI